MTAIQGTHSRSSRSYRKCTTMFGVTLRKPPWDWGGCLSPLCISLLSSFLVSGSPLTNLTCSCCKILLGRTSDHISSCSKNLVAPKEWSPTLKLLVVWHKLPLAFTFPHLHSMLSQPGWGCKPATFAHDFLCSETHFLKFCSSFKAGLSGRMFGLDLGVGGYAGACLLAIYRLLCPVKYAGKWVPPGGPG